MASCANAYKPFDEAGDFPTTSGNPVDDLTLAVYTGDFTRTKLEVSPETAENSAAAAVAFPETYAKTDGAGLSITAADKINVDAPISTIENAQAYKDGEVYTARTDITGEDGTVTKSYVKFTISGDTINVIQYVVEITTDGVSMRATYTATLTKDASAGS